MWDIPPPLEDQGPREPDHPPPVRSRGIRGGKATKRNPDLSYDQVAIIHQDKTQRPLYTRPGWTPDSLDEDDEEETASGTFRPPEPAGPPPAVRAFFVIIHSVCCAPESIIAGYYSNGKSSSSYLCAPYSCSACASSIEAERASASGLAC